MQQMGADICGTCKNETSGDTEISTSLWHAGLTTFQSRLSKARNTVTYHHGLRVE